MKRGFEHRKVSSIMRRELDDGTGNSLTLLSMIKKFDYEKGVLSMMKRKFYYDKDVPL